MKPKRRFNTANEIIDAIDLARQKSHDLIAKAESMEIKAKQLRRNGEEFEEDARYAEIQARKLRTKAFRLRSVKLVQLKDKLSEWMTPQLPAIDNHDPSIPC